MSNSALRVWSPRVVGFPSRSRRRTRSSATVFNTAPSYQNRHPRPEGSLPLGIVKPLILHLYWILTDKMFNRTTSTFSELGVLCAFARDGSHPIPDSPRAKTQRLKSEFRISKLETNYDSNPKSQFRNSKQYPNSNYQNLKLFNSIVLKIRNFVIWICFDFRISSFYFCLYLASFASSRE